MNIHKFRLESLRNKNLVDVRHVLCQHGRLVSKSGFNSTLPTSLLREKKVEKILKSCRKNGFCKVIVKDGDVLGVIAAEKSPWDTNHFGFGVGKIECLAVSDVLDSREAFEARDILIRACLSWMKQNEVKCTIARVNLGSSLDIAAYERNNFELADTLTTFYLDINNVNLVQSLRLDNLVIHLSRPGDETALMEIARSAFKQDHFHSDPRFPKQKSDALFAKWVYNSCRGLSDMVLVATKNNVEPVGFITCKIERSEPKFGVISLVAVSPPHQGGGIGTMLVKEAVRRLANDVQFILVGTQANNVVSIRTYEKAGFRLAFTEATFHKWFES